MFYSCYTSSTTTTTSATACFCIFGRHLWHSCMFSCHSIVRRRESEGKEGHEFVRELQKIVWLMSITTTLFPDRQSIQKVFFNACYCCCGRGEFYCNFIFRNAGGECQFLFRRNCNQVQGDMIRSKLNKHWRRLLPFQEMNMWVAQRGRARMVDMPATVVSGRWKIRGESWNSEFFWSSHHY